MEILKTEESTVAVEVLKLDGTLATLATLAVTPLTGPVEIGRDGEDIDYKEVSCALI